MSSPDHASDHTDHEHDHTIDTDHPNSSKKRRRPPVIRIVRLFAPRVFTAQPADFRTLVQKLTGKESTHDPINASNSPGSLAESAPAQFPHSTESTVAVDADARIDINNGHSCPVDDDITDHSYPVDDDIADQLYPVDDDDQYTCSKSKKLRGNRHDQYCIDLKPSYAPASPAEEDDHCNSDEYGECVSPTLPSILRAFSGRCSSLSPRPSPRSSCSSSSCASSPSHPTDSDLTSDGHGLPGLESADQSMVAPSQISSAEGTAASIFSSLDLISSFLMSSPTTLSPEFPDFQGALLYTSSLLPSPTQYAL